MDLTNITMTNFQQFLFTLVSIIGSILILAGYIKKWLGADIKEMDKQHTMDFLVQQFARADRHELSPIERLRIKDRYDHYVKKPEEGGLGGNSYIKEEYQRLKDAGKL